MARLGAASLRLGAAYRGSGAVLTYRTERGIPITVTWTADSSTPKVQNATFSLWIQSSADVEVTVNVNDGNSERDRKTQAILAGRETLKV